MTENEKPITRNAYKGKFVDMAKMRESAFARAKVGESTRIHHHTFEERYHCSKYEHEVITPEDVKDA